jgi:AcrR family transcriptional regulator
MQRARTDISKENRKHFILECAEQLIRSEGLASLSIGKVSKKSNLAVGTIYLYFNSKEDIIAHLTVKSRQILLDRFIEYANNVQSPLDKIEAILAAFYSFYKEKPFYNQLVTFYEINAGLEETKELKEASYKITRFVAEIVGEGKKQHLIRKDLDEMTFSFMLWGTAIGIIQLMEVKSSLLENTLNVTDFEFYKKYIKLIINSLTAK